MSALDRLLGLAPRALSALRYWRAVAWLKARLEGAQAPREASADADGDECFGNAWRGNVG